MAGIYGYALQLLAVNEKHEWRNQSLLLLLLLLLLLTSYRCPSIVIPLLIALSLSSSTFASA
jgi:hypothetical protein